MNSKGILILKNKNISVWDNQWGRLNATEKTAVQAIHLDVFGERAYSCISRWIFKQDKKILEAGSGTGRFCIALAKDFQQSSIYGLDISRNSINLSKSGIKYNNINNNLEFIQGDIFKMPFPDDFFDVTFNEGVIEHFVNYRDCIKEMIRVTKSNSKIIIAVPNWYCFPHTFYKKITKDKFEYGYEKSFKQGELIDVAKELGLKDVEVTGFYPAHGIKRLAKYSSIYHVIGNCIDFITTKLDHCTNNLISKYFGFEIIIKGIKK